MNSQRFHIRWLVAAGAAALIALALIPAAAAKPTSATEPAGWADHYRAGSDDTFIPGVTDSSTGVIRELERKDLVGDAFIPGVTDSTTGVARDLERRGLEPRAVPNATTVDDSGLHWDDGTIGIAAALAAALLMAAAAARLTTKEART